MSHDNRQHERYARAGRTEESVVLVLDSRILDKFLIISGRGIVTCLGHDTADAEVELHPHPFLATDRKTEGVVHTEIKVFSLVAASAFLVVVVTAAGIESQRGSIHICRRDVRTNTFRQ